MRRSEAMTRILTFLKTEFGVGARVEFDPIYHREITHEGLKDQYQYDQVRIDLQVPFEDEK